MIAKRCGINLGKEIVEETKKILEVHDFWKKLSPLNKVVEKAARGGFHKNRIVLVEKEAANGLASWLIQNKIKSLINPSIEEVRTFRSSPKLSFFLLTLKEYERWLQTKDFQRELRRLPHPLNLHDVNENSELTQEEILEAVSEVLDLPTCTRCVKAISKTSLVNFVILLVLHKNYVSFCCERLFCTEEKTEKCKKYWKGFFHAFKKQFFDLIKLYEIYYPVSIYLKYEIPHIYHYVDLSSYVNDFDSPFELAVLLHDAYQMGIIIFPGFGFPNVEDRPDAYLLGYMYPLEKKVSLERLASLVFLKALTKKGKDIEKALESIKMKIKELPNGDEINKTISQFTSTMYNYYDLWQFNLEEIMLLYSIWKMKRTLKHLYRKTKLGLTQIKSAKIRSILELMYSSLYHSKDFLEFDSAINLGITNSALVKGFFRSIQTVAKDKKQIAPLELLIRLGHATATARIRGSILNYSTRKVLGSKLYDDFVSILKEINKLDSDEITELCPYFLELFDCPIFGFEERVTLLTLLRSKQCDQTKEITNFLKNAILDDVIIGPSLSFEIDRLVNQWPNGNPLNFLMREIYKKIDEELFDSDLFDKMLNLFCSINLLKLFMRNPKRYFEYQYTLDRYIALQLKNGGKWYFDYFKPISSVFNVVKKLQREKKKVILLIFDGLGFLHFYFACVATYRKKPKEINDFLELIISRTKDKKNVVLSSYIPTVTGVNHLAMLFGERILYDDSILIRLSDKSFKLDTREDAPKVFSILKLNESDRKARLWKDRLPESGMQKPTTLWDILGKEALNRGLFISTNRENSLLSYLLKGNATFKQVDSYANAIEEALSDKKHDLVVSQVNLIDAFMQALNTPYPPAFFDDIVNGYWEVYLDIWRNIIERISKGFKQLRRKTVIIITADHGLAWGQTSEFEEAHQIFGSIENIRFRPKYRVGEILKGENNGQLIGAFIPGHTSRKFSSIFMLRNGFEYKAKIKQKLNLLEKANHIIFKEINLDKSILSVMIKPDFLVFPIKGMFAPPNKRKFYGGIHGGASMCELFIPLIQLEK